MADTQTRLTELLPCPFCGDDEPHFISAELRRDEGAFIECRSCGCHRDDDTDAEAIANWNTRTLRSVEPPRGREWLVIENSMKNAVFADEEARTSKGYFPRDVAEKLLGRDLGGTVWFTNVESELMREHPDWRDTEPPAVEPPREMVERARAWLTETVHDRCGAEVSGDAESLAREFTTLRSQTLDEAARVAEYAGDRERPSLRKHGDKIAAAIRGIKE